MPVSFTVIVPTHDRRETVLLALGSAFAQARPPDQVIVVADGCTDGTPEAVADAYPSVLVLDRPKAPGFGWENRGEAVVRAEGDVIAWLGDDDLWLPWHLERMAGLFEHDVADLVTTSCVRVDEHDALSSFGMDLGVAAYRAQMAPSRTRVPSTSVAHRRELVERAGGWRTVPSFGDLDLWRRMLEAGARPASVADPSALVFTAFQRRQTWDERVAQNTRWARRLADPAQREEIRAAMSLALDHERWAGSAMAAEDGSVRARARRLLRRG
jgi:glycosyltransferase involved in cell wall biosynthesis